MIQKSSFAYLQNRFCASGAIRGILPAAAIKDASSLKQMSTILSEPVAGQTGWQTVPTSARSQASVLLSCVSSPSHDADRVVITSRVTLKYLKMHNNESNLTNESDIKLNVSKTVNITIAISFIFRTSVYQSSYQASTQFNSQLSTLCFNGNLFA
jgi:hypothetical protein